MQWRHFEQGKIWRRGVGNTECVSKYTHTYVYMCVVAGKGYNIHIYNINTRIHTHYDAGASFVPVDMNSAARPRLVDFHFIDLHTPPNARITQIHVVHTRYTHCSAI